MSAVSRSVLFLLLSIGSAQAMAGDAAAAVMNAPEAQVLKTAKLMAEGVSRNAPTQVSRDITLVSAVFVADTKTFIYR